MPKISLKIIFILAIFVLPIFSTENSIIILTPHSWNYGYEQTIFFDLLAVQNESQVDFQISLSNRDNKNISFNFTQTIKSNTTKLFKFNVPSTFITGYYDLAINGSGENRFQFSNFTKDIYFKRDTSSIHLITDKSTYKASETVNIRIVGINSHLIPLKDEGFVNIKDPESNTVYQKSNLNFENGFVEDISFQLSDRPINGKWEINFQTNSSDKANIIYFEVKEYVLPKFSVNLNLPKFVYKSSKYLHGSVEAKYTYGKNVYGKLKIELIDNQYYYYRPRSTTSGNKISYIFELSPSGKTEFKIPLSLSLERSFSLDVNGTVYDEYSGDSVYDLKKLNVYQTEIYYDININYFKVNETNDYEITIQNPVGEPYLNEKVILNIKINNENYQQIKEETFRLKTDSNGKIYHSLFVGSNISSIIFLISFAKDLEQSTSIYLYKYYNYYNGDNSNTANSPFVIKLDNKSFKQNENKTLNIKKNSKFFSTDYCIQVKYLLVSRSVIRAQDSFLLCDEFNLTLKMTHLNTPKTNLVFYYINSVQNVFVQNYLLESDDIFNNHLEMSFGASIASPGDVLNLTLKTSINSTVSLCIVDQSVRLLSLPNELTKNDIQREFEAFDLSVFYPSSNYEIDAGIRGPNQYWEYPRAATDFHNNGFILLTNFKTLQPTLKQMLYEEAVFFKPDAIVTTNQQPILTTTTTFNRPNQQDNLAEVTQVRREFSETWLWRKIFIINETTVITSKVPDTITSWVATGFSFHPTFGIAVAENQNITTFKGFFVSIQLPYSIKRGEILILKAIVFNYLSIDLTDVVVTFVKTPDFQQIILKKNRKTLLDIENDIKKKIPFIRSQTGHTVTFVITPTKLGSLKLQINAQTSVAADAEIKQLLVKSEGVEQTQTQSLLVDSTKSNASSSQNISISLPEKIVSNSEYCKLQLVGDILGTAFNNLNSLLNIPCGCGEQNMIGLTPNIYALKYLLTKTKTNNVDFLTRTAKQNIQTGYTNELKYRHSDGSFSAFGQSDPSGSSWLTAFVLKSFAQANKYVTLDERILKSAGDWLISQQDKDGSFNEPGNVIHKDMQSGGANNRLTLTAYILISLLEANLTNLTVSESVLKATNYIEAKLSKVNDVYTAALVAYALDLANSEMKEFSFRRFNSFANRTLKDKLFWSKNEPKIWNDYYLIRETPTSDVEMTSYGLLIYLNRNNSNKDDTFKIAKWIISKSSSLGSYSSTQDTILALQALSEFASRILPSNSNTNLTLSAILYDSKKNRYSKTFQVDSENLLVLQSWKLPECPKGVNLISIGTGVALVQVITTYNVPKIDCFQECATNKQSSSKSIVLTQKVAKFITNNTLLIKTCIKYNRNESTGMSIIETELVSGFDVDDQSFLNSLPSSNSSANLMMCEKMKNTNKVAFYLRQMPREVYCVDWKMSRLHQVADAKNVTVSAYDYYSTDLRATIQFSLPSNITNLNSLLNDE